MAPSIALFLFQSNNIKDISRADIPIKTMNLLTYSNETQNAVDC